MQTLDVVVTKETEEQVWEEGKHQGWLWTLKKKEEKEKKKGKVQKGKKKEQTRTASLTRRLISQNRVLVKI
jgi:hypothetical protein